MMRDWDMQLDELIDKIEKEMQQRTSLLPILALKWEIS